MSIIAHEVAHQYASQFPGAFERQYFRAAKYPELFTVDPDELLLIEARANDLALIEPFMSEFQNVLERVVSFKPNEDSEVLLAVKADLDRLYNASCSLPDDQSTIRSSIAHLIETIMQSIRKGAEDDERALLELAEETEARKMHFELLNSPLIADLLSDHSVITSGQWVASLLSADKADLAQAVQLFDAEQTRQLVGQAKALLNKMASQPSVDLSEATQSLAFIEGYLVFLEQV